MDTSLYTQYPYHGVYTCDDVNYNPDKPKFKDLLERIYELMNMKQHSSRLKKQREKQRVQKLRKLKFRTSVCDDFNRDVLRCRCGALLVYADTYNPLEGIKNDRTYRQNCIDEMYQCGYTEDVPLSDLLTLRELYDLKGPEDDSVLCPFCLHDMYPVSSDHFTKNSDK